MEVAPADALFSEPLHPYTRYLISAVPIPDTIIEASRKRLPLQGEPPSTIDPPSGCPFRTRCPIAEIGVNAEIMPPLVEQQSGHFAACHFRGNSKRRYVRRVTADGLAVWMVQAGDTVLIGCSAAIRKIALVASSADRCNACGKLLNGV